jgi:predicted kinase
MKLFCHLLVGPPSSGKTTLAHQLQSHLPNAIVISTDALRAELFGDAAIQGPWVEIETLLLSRIRTAVAEHRSVIYDATNVNRSWRSSLIQKLQLPQVDWVAWRLLTPLPTCLVWNQQRDRQVPPQAITDYYHELNRCKVMTAEGFLAVLELNPAEQPISEAEIKTQLAKLEMFKSDRCNLHQAN